MSPMSSSSSRRRSPPTPGRKPRPHSSMADGGPFGPASVVVFGLFSAVAWGAGDFGGGLVGRRINVLTLVLGTQIVGMSLAFVLGIVRAEPFPATVDLFWSSISGVLGAAGVLALYGALAAGRMGVV